jgi:hypothetical protein
MFSLKKINDEVIKPPKIQKINKKLILGRQLFDDIYCNIFICAKKKSGKTVTIYKILKSCANKNTKVFIFCSTMYKSDNMKAIIKYLTKKKIEHELYTELGEDLKNIIKYIELNKSEEEEVKKETTEDKKDKHKHELLHFDEDDHEIKITIRKKKPKIISPEYIFVFDDLSTDLKSPDISKLVKQNRHYKSKVIISSQYPFDLQPQCRAQMDYWLLFGGQPEDKMEQIYKYADLSNNFNTFMEIYKDATKDKYNFLYIDTTYDNFRKNFNEIYVV